MADEPTINALDLHIGKLSLGDGDVLVVKPAGPMPADYAAHVKRVLNDLLESTGSKAKVLIMPHDAELSVLTRAEIEAKAE